jgi:hypothetical protein
VNGEWHVADGVASASLLRIDESMIESIAVTDGTRVPFVAAPRAIVSVCLMPNRAG